MSSGDAKKLSGDARKRSGDARKSSGNARRLNAQLFLQLSRIWLNSWKAVTASRPGSKS